jgi:hypothetical protein
MTTSSVQPGSREDVLATAERLVDEGRPLDAIDALRAANHAAADPVLEERLVAIRLGSLDAIRSAAPRVTWPVEVDDLFAGQAGIPEITPDELSIDAVASGVVHHGSLWVRGLLDADQVALLCGDIDRAIEGHDRWREGAPAQETAPWFVPYSPGTTAEDEASTKFARQWVRSGGGAWLVDSPRTMFDLLEMYEATGLHQILTEYLGERPAFSVEKSTLRRVPIDLTGADWHQDGAFLGEGIRTLNVWLALTDCGIDAPGLDLVPRRLNEILETGTRGAWFEWSVGQELVDEASADAPVVRPFFRAGDALLFDEYNLHRTALAPEMTHSRYAVESWFFAPSTYPGDQTPIVY